jgi:hypothetical protein
MGNGMARSETALAVQTSDIAARPELTLDELVAQAKKIHDAMERVMISGEHYGVIPGTTKPTLYQPGAQKLNLMFRLDPQYLSSLIGKDIGEGGHLTYKSICTLYHIPTGQRFGSGEGIASTREAKYAYRFAQRKCPECGVSAIARSKEEWGGGYYCNRKREGCGAKFATGDERIEGQPLGRVTNENLADEYNTVLKMANKRALVAATLNVTAASDLFTQDLEDDDDPVARAVTPPTVAPPSAAPDAAGANNRSLAAGDAEDARAQLNAEVIQLGNDLKLKAQRRAELWSQYCGNADPRTVDIAALTDLVAALKTMKTVKP